MEHEEEGSGEQLDDAQRAWVEQHLRLVQRVVQKYPTLRREQREDLRQHLSLELCKLARRYDPSRGYTPATFIMFSLTQKAKSFFRDFTWAVQPPREIREARADQRASIVETYISERSGSGCLLDPRIQDQEVLRTYANPLGLNSTCLRDVDPALLLPGPEESVLLELAEAEFVAAVCRVLTDPERWAFEARLTGRSMRSITAELGLSQNPGDRFWKELKRRLQCYWKAWQRGEQLRLSPGNSVWKQQEALKQAETGEGYTEDGPG